jgi:hypothetical protein
MEISDFSSSYLLFFFFLLFFLNSRRYYRDSFWFIISIFNTYLAFLVDYPIFLMNLRSSPSDSSSSTLRKDGYQVFNLKPWELWVMLSIIIPSCSSSSVCSSMQMTGLMLTKLFVLLLSNR